MKPLHTACLFAALSQRSDLLRFRALTLVGKAMFLIAIGWMVAGGARGQEQAPVVEWQHHTASPTLSTGTTYYVH